MNTEKSRVICTIYYRYCFICICTCTVVYNCTFVQLFEGSGNKKNKIKPTRLEEP